MRLFTLIVRPSRTPPFRATATPVTIKLASAIVRHPHRFKENEVSAVDTKKVEDKLERKKAKRTSRKKAAPKAKRTTPRGSAKKKLKKLVRGQSKR